MNEEVNKVLKDMRSESASLFAPVRDELKVYADRIEVAMKSDFGARVMRASAKIGNEGEIDAADLFAAVMIGMMGKNPLNGMKLKPCSHLIRQARVKLERIIELANKGLKAKEAK